MLLLLGVRDWDAKLFEKACRHTLLGSGASEIPHGSIANFRKPTKKSNPFGGASFTA